VRVVMISRANLFTHPGGDSIQVQKTAEYLNRLEGVSVDMKTVAEDIDYSQYDLLHLFNISRPADLLGVIKKAQLPYVLSTIFIDYSETEKNHPSKLRRFLSSVCTTDQLEYVKTMARIMKGQDKLTATSYVFRGQKKSLIRVLKGAALLLPNSESEYQRLSQTYGIQKDYKVIPNAIDVEVFKPTSEENDALSQYKDAVICVGQITPVKNQWNLIKALNGTSYQLFIIGKPASNSEAYFKKCMDLAKSNVTFVPFVEQKNLAKVYAMAKVHALPSWFETTGLVSLEASYMGCNIVVTDKGDQKEYFGNDAWYCDPNDPQSILKAIHKAYEAPFKESLQRRIKEKYTWQKTAEATLKAYQKVLKK